MTIKDDEQEGGEKAKKELVKQGEVLPQVRLLVVGSVGSSLTENC